MESVPLSAIHRIVKNRALPFAFLFVIPKNIKPLFIFQLDIMVFLYYPSNSMIINTNKI